MTRRGEAELSVDQARRIALAAQGFDRPRPGGAVRITHLRALIRRLGLLQIDYVNVLVPAHYLVPFSRLGPYRMALLDEVVYRRREFTERWAREASIVPVETWPLLRHRMETHRVRPYGFETFMRRHADYAEWVLEQVRARGPLTADQMPDREGIARRLPPGVWHGSVARAFLEAHFGRGALAVSDRRRNFARAYDLAERVLPAAQHGRVVERADAERELLRLAARAHGVGTADDLADYYRMPIRDARARLAELVAAGELRQVRVTGWREPAYLHPAARRPRRISACALLSPFDPLVWHRPRIERLFDFEYRIEIYVPEAKRRWGYYVLPFLFGDRLAARVDLKADRRNRRLLVLASYVERHAAPGPVAAALAQELKTLARWLGLEEVSVARRRGFDRALAARLMSG